MKRENAITFKGQPMSLVGTQLNLGDVAPDFHVVNAKLEPRSLADYAGRPFLVSVVPSLDTGVCEAQTNRRPAFPAGRQGGSDRPGSFDVQPCCDCHL